MADRQRLYGILSEIAHRKGKGCTDLFESLRDLGIRVPSSWAKDARAAHDGALERLASDFQDMIHEQLNTDPHQSANAPLHEVQKAILRVLADGSTYTADDLEAKVGCSRSTLFKYLKRLLREGKVKKQRGGGYYRPECV